MFMVILFYFALNISGIIDNIADSFVFPVNRGPYS